MTKHSRFPAIPGKVKSSTSARQKKSTAVGGSGGMHVRDAPVTEGERQKGGDQVMKEERKKKGREERNPREKLQIKPT